MVGLLKRQKIDPGTDGSSNENYSKPVVYVRYKDHVLFKNFQQPIEDAVERETLGWLAKETGEIILFEYDRTTPDMQPCNGQSTGLIILKNRIVRCTIACPAKTNSMRYYIASQGGFVVG